MLEFPKLETKGKPGLSTIKRLDISLNGRVQAVGFRPFVFRLARKFQLTGGIYNDSGAVRIIVQGFEKNLRKFQRDLIQTAPPLANPIINKISQLPNKLESEFRILPSVCTEKKSVFLPPDFFVCEDCLAEMQDPDNRRFRYPLISCTQCGPRYTIIESLPYDRKRTTLKSFALCPDCQREYNDPGNRRFHAETISCHHCGPQLQYRDHSHTLEESEKIIAHVLSQLKQGKILAIKGIGGYHLVCDATNCQSVARLRKRKQRPHKPFAVMFPEKGNFRKLIHQCSVKQSQLNLLSSPERPIVLVEKSRSHSLADNIAPGLRHIGVMIASNPLLSLLSEDYAKPLIVTSGNLSGEPIIIDKQIAEQKLGDIADGFIHHNRTILHPVDDSVFQFTTRQPQPIRLARGIAPLELTLPAPISKPTIALGALYKNAIALAFDNRLIVSPHIGNMDSPQSLRSMEGITESLQSLYQVKAKQYVCDAHPDYINSRWAKKQTLESKTVFHHHAHASALAFEQAQIKQWLMFTWDGVGYGTDKSIWGGETFFGSPGNWHRVASLKPFFLPGGDAVARKPLLSALSLLWETKLPFEQSNQHHALRTLWEKHINTTQSSAMARLFDAAAAILGIVEDSTYDGHAPMLLEFLCDDDDSTSVELPVRFTEKRKLWEIDWKPLLELLLRSDLTQRQRASAFHTSLARMVAQQIEIISLHYSFNAIGFSGGVFQNKMLCHFIQQQLKKNDKPFYFHRKLPSNDAAICVGQIMEVLNCNGR